MSDYLDADRVAPWAAEGMAYCVSAGLLRGVSDAYLAPKDAMTRASMAVLLERLLE